MERRGDPVPGSRYIRDFCRGCHEPIRVSKLAAMALCEDCTGEKVKTEDTRSFLTPSQAAVLWKTAGRVR